MTVAELIERLQQEVPSRLVVVDGYETGFDTPDDLIVYSVKAHQLSNPPQHDGAWQLADDDDPEAQWAVALHTRRG
jgi:hypothetical protein